MSDPQGKTPMDKYLDHIAMIKANEEKYTAMNKETKTAQKTRDNIQRWKDELVELEKHKDDIVLSKTCIAHLEDRVKENYYGRKKQLKTNAIQKGIECENEAVFILNKALWTNHKKSRGERMENERCTGHEDIDAGDHTIDTKVCESFDTFPILTEDLDNMYRWQGQGYMRLKGEQYKKHIVAKVLVNSPVWQIKNKLYIAYINLQKKYDGNEEYVSQEYELEAREIFLNHVFDKQVTVNSDWASLRLSDEEVIPNDKRVKTFAFERDNNAINKIIKRVQECRAYLAQQWY